MRTGPAGPGLGFEDGAEVIAHGGGGTMGLVGETARNRFQTLDSLLPSAYSITQGSGDYYDAPFAFSRFRQLIQEYFLAVIYDKSRASFGRGEATSEAK